MAIKSIYIVIRREDDPSRCYIKNTVGVAYDQASCIELIINDIISLYNEEHQDFQLKPTDTLAGSIYESLNKHNYYEFKDSFESYEYVIETTIIKT